MSFSCVFSLEWSDHEVCGRCRATDELSNGRLVPVARVTAVDQLLNRDHRSLAGSDTGDKLRSYAMIPQLGDEGPAATCGGLFVRTHNGSGLRDNRLHTQRDVQGGCRWMVDVELEKFFDRVSHDVPMGELAKNVARFMCLACGTAGCTAHILRLRAGLPERTSVPLSSCSSEGRRASDRR